MLEEDKKRLELESIPIHHQSSDYDITGDEVYYPINHNQLRDLLGKMLTLLDAMNLPERVHTAQKALIVQSAWLWWDGVYSNATTSYAGCIAPIVTEKHKDSKFYPSNRWGYKSEEEYLDSIPKAISLEELNKQ